MQGGDKGEAEPQHNNRLEDIDELTLPTLARENEIDMQEVVTGIKRGQSECNSKLRRREGIKRVLRDITPVSYEECDASWDLEDQSKKCNRAVNCLLASFECKGKSEPIRDERGDLPVHLPPDMVAELGRQAGTRDAARAIHPALIPGPSSSNTGWYSNIAVVLSATATTASSNHTTDTVA